MESQGVKIEKQKNEVKQPLALSDSERAQLALIRSKIENAKLQRDQKFRVFSGLDFLTDDQANLDSRNSYIRPKKNDDEVRINTGTVEKKMMTVCNEILALNMQSEVQVYDENDKVIRDLGTAFQYVLKRSKQQEADDDLQFQMIWELATRRALMMEEYYEEKVVTDKRKKKYDLEKGEVEFETKEWRICRPRKRIIDPRSVLLGDISISASRDDDQPFKVLYDRMSWEQARTIFGKFKNFVTYVRPGPTAMDGSWFQGQFDWRLYNNIKSDECEILYYKSFPDDEFQIIINGVPMLPVNCPLDYEHEGYRLKTFVFRELEHLAYGQLFTINAKVLAGVHDEMLRLIVRHWRKYIEKTVVHKGKKVLSRDIFNTGAMISGMNPEDIKILDDKDTGLSASEIEGFNLISQKIEEEIGVGKLMQGMETKKMTATQTLEQMKQAIKAIGPLVYSWMRVVRVMDELRIFNIIENSTDPLYTEYQDGEIKKIYRNFTVSDVKLDKNITGSMVVQFTDQDPTPELLQAIRDYEKSQERQGNHIRYMLINVEKLRQWRLHWYLTVSSQERESTALQKITFTDELNQAAIISQMTGRRILGDTVVNTFERLYKTKNFFEKAPDQAALLAQKAQMMKDAGMDISGEINNRISSISPQTSEISTMGQSPMGGEMEAALAAGAKRPSINSATQ